MVFGVWVFRCSGVQVFRWCSGVRWSGVRVFGVRVFRYLVFGCFEVCVLAFCVSEEFGGMVLWVRSGQVG